MLNKQKQNKMKKEELKKVIENLAKEENITFIEACSAMQTAASLKGDEDLIMIIHDLKMKSINK